MKEVSFKTNVATGLLLDLLKDLLITELHIKEVSLNRPRKEKDSV